MSSAKLYKRFSFFICGGSLAHIHLSRIHLTLRSKIAVNSTRLIMSNILNRNIIADELQGISKAALALVLPASIAS